MTLPIHRKGTLLLWMRSTLSQFFVGVLLVAANGYAFAGVVGADLLTQGDGLITRETGSGREWIDVTATINQSFNSIVAGYGGFLNMGFRIAKLSEVGDLFRSAGITNLTPAGGPENFDSANSLMQLIGCGAQCNLPWRYTEGFALFDNVNNPYAGGVARANLFISAGSASVAFGDGTNEFQFAGSGCNDCADQWEGVWLVRDPIPEPETYAMMLVGLGMLGFVARRKSNKRNYPN